MVGFRIPRSGSRDCVAKDAWTIFSQSEVCMSFNTFGLHPTLLRAIHALGYTDPTPIQRATIPAVLAGRDLIGCAQTGTGKTAAYLLPVLHRLLHDPIRGPRMLVVLPTRELAVQVDAHRRELTAHTSLRGAAIYGGVPTAPQAYALRESVDVVAATPGRLLDHLARHPAWFARLQVLVLDEADRMLDMGFLPDLRKILTYLPRRRPTLLLSATIPPAITALAEEMLRAPLTVEVGSQSAPPARLKHTVVPRVPTAQNGAAPGAPSVPLSGRCPGVYADETPRRSAGAHPSPSGFACGMSACQSDTSP